MNSALKMERYLNQRKVVKRLIENCREMRLERVVKLFSVSKFVKSWKKLLLLKHKRQKTWNLLTDFQQRIADRIKWKALQKWKAVLRQRREKRKLELLSMEFHEKVHSSYLIFW